MSEETGLIAVQGPHAERLVGRLADVDVPAIGYYQFRRGRVAGVPGIISRTGYTGEDGFELYLPAGGTERVWDRLLAEGKPDGAAPIGLGARDTLRLEMKYALYGNDIDETTNPLEAGLGWVVKPAKGRFLGRDAHRAGPGRGPPAPARGLRDGRPRGRPARLPDPPRRRAGRRGDLGLLRTLGRPVHRASATCRRRSPPWAPRSPSRSGGAARPPVSSRRRSIRRASRNRRHPMATYPAELRYTREHEWAKVEGKRARVGITHYRPGPAG